MRGQRWDRVTEIALGLADSHTKSQKQKIAKATENWVSSDNDDIYNNLLYYIVFGSELTAAVGVEI